MRNSYNTSKDYEKLYDLVMEGHVIVAFSDHEIIQEKHIFKDILQVMWDGTSIKGFVRGRSYIDISNFSVELSNSQESLRSMFISECKQYDLGWIKP